MDGPATPRRRLRVGLLTLAAIACYRPIVPPSGTIDLLAELQRPRLVQQTSEILPGHPWLHGFHGREAQPDGRLFAWASAAPATIDFALATTRPHTVQIDLRPYSPPGAEPLRLRIALDDQPLTSVELVTGWQLVELAIPPTADVPGWRTLTLTPSRANRPADVEGGDDRRELSFCLRALRVLPERDPNEPQWREGRLRLPPGTAAIWPLALPRTGHLEAEADGPLWLWVERDGTPAVRAPLDAAGPLPAGPIRLSVAPRGTAPVTVHELRLGLAPATDDAGDTPGSLVLGLDGAAATPGDAPAPRAVADDVRQRQLELLRAAHAWLRTPAAEQRR